MDEDLWGELKNPAWDRMRAVTGHNMRKFDDDDDDDPKNYVKNFMV
jgi:hypothetical protein